MNILFTAFKGKNNVSKILLDNITSENKLYLTNSYNTSVKELYELLENDEFDLIVSFGRYPNRDNSICIELIGRDENSNIELITNYDYNRLKDYLLELNYQVKISKRTNYLCNNIYFHGLKFIKDNNLKTKMILIHIPKITNSELIILAKYLQDYFNDKNYNTL